ncbi:hypothetical protein TNCV_1674571 [Trichonephila clavipes]|nr:hypothetical protein TNCV_1674571 [Trichonephila clavipes]
MSKILKTPVGLNYPTVSSEEFVVVDDANEAHEQSSPRHSIASNTSSNVSYPPSPRERRTTAPAAASVPILPLHAPNAEDHGGSSSYESQS